MALSTNPASAAAAGALTLAPLAAANTIVAGRIEPFFSLIRPGPHTSAFEYALLATVLLLLPVGAFIAARPLITGGTFSLRPIYVLNGLVAAILLMAFIAIGSTLGTEIYRCDVLQIPNCD